MASALRTLVLNADYRPLSTFPPSLWAPEDAILAVLKDKVDVVESWDAVYRSQKVTLAVPKVIALKHYVAVDAEPRFCRRAILVRDRFTCQYCGRRFAAAELTFDHVVPRSAGGRTCWTNILTACVGCNSLKGSVPANYSGRRGVPAGRSLRPLKEPRRPTAAELFRAGLDSLPDRLIEDFGSWLYWSTELDA